MKEFVNASIAGIAFRMDADAYAKLDGYIRSIKSHYGGSPEGKEIIADIETRIAEIILSRQENSAIVGVLLAEEIIARLGMPDEISDAAADTAAEQGGIRRKFYRNPDGSKIAGVCNGIAAFFSIDVSVVRLVFLLPLVISIIFLASGKEHAAGNFFWITTAIYLIAWIIAPKAKTPLQKLEMRGERITTSKIEETFRETFTDIDDRIRRRPSPKSEKNASIFAEIVSVVGKIILLLLKIALVFITLNIVFFIVAILTIMTILLIPATGALSITPLAVGTILIVLTGMLMVIPLALLTGVLVCTVVGRRVKRGWVIWPIITWFVVLGAAFVIAVSHADKIQVEKINITNIFKRAVSIIESSPNVEWYSNGRKIKSSTRVVFNNRETVTVNETIETPIGDTLYIKPAPGQWNGKPRVEIIRGADEVEDYTVGVVYRRMLNDRRTFFSFNIKAGEGKSMPEVFETVGDTLFLTGKNFNDLQYNIDILIPEGREFAIEDGIKYSVEERKDYY